MMVDQFQEWLNSLEWECAPRLVSSVQGLSGNALTEAIKGALGQSVDDVRASLAERYGGQEKWNPRT